MCFYPAPVLVSPDGSDSSGRAAPRLTTSPRQELDNDIEENRGGPGRTKVRLRFGGRGRLNPSQPKAEGRDDERGRLTQRVESRSHRPFREGKVSRGDKDRLGLYYRCSPGQHSPRETVLTGLPGGRSRPPSHPWPPSRPPGVRRWASASRKCAAPSSRPASCSSGTP